MMANMKQTWDATSGFFDFSKALTASDGMRHNFTLVRGVDLHPDQWDQIVYHLIKYALLEPHSIIIGPNDRPYLQVYVPSREEIDIMMNENDGVKINPGRTSKVQSSWKTDQVTYKNFAGVCKIAIENHAGLALYSSKDQREPNMTMRFGALYSYLQYGDAGGPAQLIDNMIRAIRTNPQEPKHAIADENDLSYIEGEPSEDFFNEFLRICIRQEFRIHTGNNNLEVDFMLREQNMYVMRHMIVVKTSQSLGNQEETNRLMQNMTWYMPLYLPLAVKTEDAIITYQ